MTTTSQPPAMPAEACDSQLPSASGVGCMDLLEHPARIVALSGGKDSTAMAIELSEREPSPDYQFCITPTKRELPAMDAHWAKLERLLGKPLVRIPAPSLVELIVKFKTLPNWRMRFCTRLIKIEPFMAYAEKLKPAISYIGIRADEVIGENAREGTDWSGKDGVRQDFPMVRWGWGLSKVMSYLKERDIIPPPRTDCDWCFFQRLIEWYELWRDHPDRYAEGIAIEKWTGHTFRSDQRDSWPASMEELAKCFAAGRVPKETRGRERKTMCSWCAR